MVPGISTACLYPELTEKALKQLAKRGVSATEIFFNAPSELEGPYIRELARIARDGGIRIVSIHPFTSGFEPLLLFSSYRRRTLDGFECYKRYFHAANLLGADYIIIHGDHREHNRSRTFYFHVFGELMEIARQMGVMVIQENVCRCCGYTPDFFLEMAACLPEARFVLDIKQCIRANVPIPDMVRAMGSRICHVHISDHNDMQDCLPIGKGNYDLTGFLRDLRENFGFDGAAIQELYRNNYGDIGELLEGYHTLAQCIRHAEKGWKEFSQGE